MARGRKSSLRIVLGPEERQTLERWQRSTTIAAGLARRGKIFLLLAAGSSQFAVAQAVGVQRTVVRQWAKRFLAQRVDGLADAHGRGAKGGFPPEVAIHVVRLACERPDMLSRSLSQWDCHELARQLIAEGIVEENIGLDRTADSGHASIEALAPASVAVPQTPSGRRLLCHRRRADLTSIPVTSGQMRWCSPSMRKPPCSRGPDHPRPCQPGPTTCPTAWSMSTSGRGR